MLKHVSLLALMLIGTAATATAQIPMSKFARTFSSSLTRGYYFQAPVDFRIIGLRVPDESANGTQNVELFNMGSKPPAFPGTGTAGQVLYQAGVPSNQIIPCNIKIPAGNWVGVLGACGTSTMANSYGTSANKSNVLGFPVVLNRFLTQSSLGSSGGGQPYSTENAGPIGRVEMFVAPISPEDLPAFTNTYSRATNSRGYYFQAPKNMTITGLRVPDETGHGLQNVEVFRLNGAPAAYPATSAGGSEFNASGIPSNEIIPTNLSFAAGEWIGILGTCGAATMHNSYGTGPHATTMFGAPVTLTRFISQTNISTSSNSPYSAATGSVGRVQLYARLDDACNEVEMPAFSTTYNDSNATRGYYFRTPVALNITGLQVPDESGNGTQNVEVFNLGAVPPAFPATGTGTSVFYAAGVPSNQVVPMNLHFAPGDWIGILGACGTTTMANSYGSSAPVVDVLGHPVTLARFMTQTNLNSSGGNQAYSGIATGTMSRVHMFLGQAPVATDYGVGTDTGSGIPTLTTCVLPNIGETGQLVMEQWDTNNLGGWLMVGLKRGNIPVLGGTILVDLSIATIPVAAPMPTGGEVPINLPVPNDPALINCSTLTFQGICLTPSGTSIYSATNGTEWQIGR